MCTCTLRGSALEHVGPVPFAWKGGAHGRAGTLGGAG